MNRSNFLDELIRLEEVLEMNSLRQFELIISILFGHGHENLRGRLSVNDPPINSLDALNADASTHRDCVVNL